MVHLHSPTRPSRLRHLQESSVLKEADYLEEEKKDWHNINNRPVLNNWLVLPWKSNVTHLYALYGKNLLHLLTKFHINVAPEIVDFFFFAMFLCVWGGGGTFVIIFFDLCPTFFIKCL